MRLRMLISPPSTAVSILALGFLLGLRHATDFDHIVAVTTIVVRERRLWASSVIGVLWGIGHTMTILVVGGAIVVFKVVIPARIGLSMELAVSVMLIALGAANLSGPGRAMTTGPAPNLWRRSREGPSSWAPGCLRVRPLVVGVIHGLAGSAAIALLVVSAIGDSRWAVAYLAIFGLGTIVGMVLLTTTLALSFTYAARRFERVNTALVRFTGLASVALGLLIVYELVLHGLLSSTPHWTPT